MDEQTYTYAIIDDLTGLVVSRVSWDGVSEWSPGEGVTAVRVDDPTEGGVGDTYRDGAFTVAGASATE